MQKNNINTSLSAAGHSSVSSLSAADHSSVSSLSAADHSSVSSLSAADHSSVSSLSAADHSSVSSLSAADHSIIPSLLKLPLVSIVCITYNHEPFLRQTLDSFLMQETTFPVEIILAEDCSTDGTRRVIDDFIAQHADGELEKNHYRLENGMSLRYIWSEQNVGAKINELRAMQAARGKYIAFCEGDDSWTEPWKLQRQVDWMEVHPEYSVTFHRFKNKWAKDGSLHEDKCGTFISERAGEKAEGADLQVMDFFNYWVTQPLTMVYKRESLDLNLYTEYEHFRDAHQIYYLLKAGRGYLFSFEAGLRMVHDGGMSSGLKTQKRYCEVSLPIDKEFYEKTHDAGPKQAYMETLDTCVYEYKNEKRLALSYAWQLFLISHDFRHFMHQLKDILR